MRPPLTLARARGPLIVRTGATVSRTTVGWDPTPSSPETRLPGPPKTPQIPRSPGRRAPPQQLGRDVDRSLGTPREREHERPARRGDACELVGERDHVREHDEVEVAVRKVERRGVADLEADAAGELG